MGLLVILGNRTSALDSFQTCDYEKFRFSMLYFPCFASFRIYNPAYLVNHPGRQYWGEMSKINGCDSPYPFWLYTSLSHLNWVTNSQFPSFRAFRGSMFSYTALRIYNKTSTRRKRTSRNRNPHTPQCENSVVYVPGASVVVSVPLSVYF